MIELLASETAETFGLSQILELAVVISTFALVLVTAGLWYATAQVHKDEIHKMTDALSHDNDNMTDVALAEIASHHSDKVRQMRRISSRKHR